jgi:glycine cleavage system H protein
MATIPSDFKYTREHEWANYDANKGIVTIGITEHAAEKLGEIVYVELPEEGAQIEHEETFGIVESTKAVSDLFAPVSGEVLEVNDVLLDTPDLVSEDPYDEGWMIRVKLSDPSELEELMNADEYEVFIGELEEEEEE